MAINRDFASPSRNSKTKIRRPINAFLLYCNENRPQLKVENPGVKHVHISKILAIQWKRLAQERKNEYLEMARAIKESHGIANPEYRYCPKEVRLKWMARREARKRKTKNKVIDKVIEDQSQNESKNDSERPRNLTSLLTALNPTLKPSEIQSLRLALMSRLSSISRNAPNSSSHSTETARNMRAMNENSSDSSLDRQTTNANQRSDEKDVNEMVNETNQSEESDGSIGGSITDSMGPYRETYGNDFDDSDEDQDI